jgi:hypothetical protein
MPQSPRMKFCTFVDESSMFYLSSLEDVFPCD